MGCTWSTKGTITLHPPVPLAEIDTVLNDRWTPFQTAPAGLEPHALAQLVARKERILVPADDATYDDHGRPSHIKAVHIAWGAHYDVIGDSLRRITIPTIAIGHDFDGDITWEDEEGTEGEIGFYEDGELIWDEIRLARDARPRAFESYGGPRDDV